MNTITEVTIQNGFIVLTHEKTYPRLNAPHKEFIPLSPDEAEKVAHQILDAVRSTRIRFQKMDWVVRVYDEYDNQIDEWHINDRTETQAFREADVDVRKKHGTLDWTMTPQRFDRTHIIPLDCPVGESGGE